VKIACKHIDTQSDNGERTERTDGQTDERTLTSPVNFVDSKHMYDKWKLTWKLY